MLRTPNKHAFFLLLFVGFILTSFKSFAQNQDSITHHYDSLASIKLQALDSSSNKFNTKVDSIQLLFNNIRNPNLNQLSSKLKPKQKLGIPDSLKATRELDSIKLGITHK